MNKLFIEDLYTLKGYTPGDQPTGKIIKLNTNENPYPPSPKILKSISKILKTGLLRKYPNPISDELRIEIAKQNKIKKENVLVVNGSDEGLAILFRACLKKESTLIMPDPTYSLYSVLASLCFTNTRLVKIPLLSDFHLDFETLMQQKGDLLAFATPNAPTGIIESKDKLIQLISNFSNAVLCDEAYIDFAPKNSSLIPEIKNFKNLFISRTFSKSYSLAGLRVGYIISNEENIAELLKIKDSYNLGMLEQKIALEAFKDQKYLSKTVSKITNSRKKLTGKLSKKGFQVLESNTNFLFAKPPSPYKADELFEYLKSKKIFIRYFKDTLTKDYIRISIGLEKENKKLLKEIFAFCKL